MTVSITLSDLTPTMVGQTLDQDICYVLCFYKSSDANLSNHQNMKAWLLHSCILSLSLCFQ